MQLDNDKIAQGDKVYDFIDGYGTVVDVSVGSFVVNFGRNKLIPYNSKGVRLAEKPTRLGRTLYWDNPANYFIPSKGEDKNNLARMIGSAVSTYMGSH